MSVLRWHLLWGEEFIGACMESKSNGLIMDLASSFPRIAATLVVYGTCHSPWTFSVELVYSKY